MTALNTRPVSHFASLVATAERQRIERDLHDGAQTLLVSVRLKLGLAAERAAELDVPDLHRMLLELGDEAQAALDGVRTSSASRRAARASARRRSTTAAWRRSRTRPSTPGIAPA